MFFLQQLHKHFFTFEKESTGSQQTVNRVNFVLGPPNFTMDFKTKVV